MTHEVDQDRDVAGVEAHPFGDDPGQGDPVVGVVTGSSLAEVVQQRADEEEVGATDRAHQLARAATASSR